MENSGVCVFGEENRGGSAEGKNIENNVKVRAAKRIELVKYVDKERIK